MGEVRGGCPEQAKICCNFTGSSEFANKYQKQGVGRVIMEHIMAYLDKETPAGCYITLMADVPALYEKFGFALARPESEGMYIIK